MAEYTDWHPPIMAFMLSLVLRAGGDIGWVTLAQYLAGFLGIRELVLVLSDRLHMTHKAQDLIAAGMIMLLASPLTPLSIYLATFWKDTWLAILIVWIAMLLLRLIWYVPKSAARRVSELIGLVTVITLAILVRHNAITMLPFILIVFIVILRTREFRWSACLAIASIPALVYLAFNSLQYSALGTQRMYPESQVYATDLVGMVVLSPKLLDDLQFTREHLLDGYASSYVIGDNSSIYIYGDDSVVDQGFVAPDNARLLRSEHLLAIRTDPPTWIQLRWTTFRDFVRPGKDRYGFHTRIEPNEFGLSLNERFRPVRAVLFLLTNAVATNKGLKWFSFAHAPWIILTGMAIPALLIHTLRRRGNDLYRIIGLLLLIPFAYYLSYFLAITAPDFRFMYPATLLNQVVLLSLFGVGMSTVAGSKWGESRSR